MEILKETETSENRGDVVRALDAKLASRGLQGTLPLNRRSAEFSHLKRYFRHADGAHSDATNRHNESYLM